MRSTLAWAGGVALSVAVDQSGADECRSWLERMRVPAMVRGILRRLSDDLVKSDRRMIISGCGGWWVWSAKVEGAGSVDQAADGGESGGEVEVGLDDDLACVSEPAEFAVAGYPGVGALHGPTLPQPGDVRSHCRAPARRSHAPTRPDPGSAAMTTQGWVGENSGRSADPISAAGRAGPHPSVAG